MMYRYINWAGEYSDIGKRLFSREYSGKASLNSTLAKRPKMVRKDFSDRGVCEQRPIIANRVALQESTPDRGTSTCYS